MSHCRGAPVDPLRILLELEHRLGESSGGFAIVWLRHKWWILLKNGVVVLWYKSCPFVEVDGSFRVCLPHPYPQLNSVFVMRAHTHTLREMPRSAMNDRLQQPRETNRWFPGTEREIMELAGGERERGHYIRRELRFSSSSKSLVICTFLLLFFTQRGFWLGH